MDERLVTAEAASGAIEVTPRTFVDLYGSDRDRLARAVGMTLGDADLGAEAVDEAFVRAYQRWPRVGRLADPSGWVFRVAVNWATSVLRRRRPPSVRPDRDPTDVSQPTEPSLLAALAELPVAQRAVVVCRYYLHLSEEETAEALGIRPGTVKSRSHRAMQTLQVRVAHLSPEEDDQ